jgi:hypothetical protein
MGYTQYFYRKEKLDKKVFSAFAKDCRKVLEVSGIPLCCPSKENGKWIDVSGFKANSNCVNFNGEGDDGHETFWFARNVTLTNQIITNGRVFGFCKTNEKPYDICVVACLILAKLYFKDDVIISSDGDSNDWQKGLKLVEGVLKCSLSLFFTEHEGKEGDQESIEVIKEEIKVMEVIEDPEVKRRLVEEFYNTELGGLIG